MVQSSVYAEKRPCLGCLLVGFTKDGETLISPPINSYFSLFRRYLANDRLRVVLLAALTLGSLIFRLLAPQYLRVFIDAAVAGETLQVLRRIVLIYTIVSLLRQGLVVAYRTLCESIGLLATDTMRKDIVEHTLSLDLSYHKEHTPGEMISRLDHDVSSVSDFFAKFWSGILVSSLSLFGALAIILGEAPLLAAILLGSTSLSLWGLIKLKDKTVPLVSADMAARADHYATMEEHFTASEDLRANGGLPYTYARFTKTLQTLKRTHRDSYLAWSSLWAAMQLVFSLNTVLTFAFCYYYWQLGSMQIGTAFMLVNYSEQLRGPINELRTRLQDLQRADAALARLRETLALQSGINDEGKYSFSEEAPRLIFDEVTFGYEEGQTVLDRLSFVLEPGKILGLLGRTGSGKSSLVRLLMRFYSPQTGSITLGEHLLGDYPLRDLRRNIAFVTQEVQLFKASLRDNLTFFDTTYDDQVILQAIEHLGLSDWLTTLPRGLDSVFSEDFGLSAGESQLLAIARALLHNPRLVILDEASARLDPATEQRLTKALEQLLSDRTAIIIAHRLRTLDKADNILILDNGHILEYGSAKELRDNRTSLFAQLIERHEVDLDAFELLPIGGVQL